MHVPGGAGVQTPPPSPYNIKATSPDDITLSKREDKPRRSISRSLSTPGPNSAISNASDPLPTPSRRTQDMRAKSKDTPPGSKVIKRSHDIAGVTPGATGQSARPTATHIATQAIATASVGTPVMSPAPNQGEPRRVAAVSSPARMERSDWLATRRVESNRHFKQFDFPDDEIAASSANSSNSSNTVQSDSATKSRPSKLSHHRRSINLKGEHHIVKPEAPLPYSKLASAIIKEELYEQLPRQGKLIVTAFCAVLELYSTGSKEFGAEWSWKLGVDEPLRNWGQRGQVLRDANANLEYFNGRKKFESRFMDGTLAAHFAHTVAAVKDMQPGLLRNASLLKLVKQGDHVLNLSLEVLRGLTLRENFTPKATDVVWEAMVEDEPGEESLNLIHAYFRENCVTVQAFINAFLLVAEAAGKLVVPQITPDDMLKTFYFLAPHVLGYPYTTFQKFKAQLKTDEVTAGLKSLGMEESQLTAWLNEFKNKRKDAFNVAKVVNNLANQEKNELTKAFHVLNSKSQTLVNKLGAGDQRFARAAGLSSIIDPRPDSNPTEPQGLQALPVTSVPLHAMLPTDTTLPNLPQIPANLKQ